MIILLISLLAISFAQSTYAKQYRLDYTYYQKTDAFYKLHLDVAHNLLAKRICESEGGALIVLSSEEEKIYVHDMVFNQNPDIGDHVWIGKDAIHHKSAERVIMPTARVISSASVMTRGGQIELLTVLNFVPFVCKIDAKDVVYNPQCDMYSIGYEYYEDVGSCYKIPRIAYKWNEAYDECRADGAHLVVLNSELEHRFVHNLTLITKPVPFVQSSFYFFAGIRAEKNENGSQGVFKTIFNQTLAEAGYDQWSENEPNNANNDEFCGTIFKNDGKYNDVTCTHYYAFICEKDIGTTWVPSKKAYTYTSEAGNAPVSPRISQEFVGGGELITRTLVCPPIT